MIRVPDGSQVMPRTETVRVSALRLADAQWAAPTIHLFTNNVTLDPLIAVADLTEMTGNNYAPVTVTGWSAVQHEADGSIRYQAVPAAIFQGPSTADGVPATGYYLLGGGTGTPLLMVVRFDTPQDLPDQYSFLTVLAIPQFPA